MTTESKCSECSRPCGHIICDDCAITIMNEQAAARGVEPGLSEQAVRNFDTFMASYRRRRGKTPS